MQLPRGIRTPRELLRKRTRISVRLDEELGIFLGEYAIGHRLSTTQVIEVALKQLMQTTTVPARGAKRDRTP